MKKSIFIAILMIAICAASDSFGQASFGIKGSFDMFNITIKDTYGNKVGTKLVPKYDAGIFAEVPVADEFFIRPELLYVTKGTKLTNSYETTFYKLSYLELPILFLYKGALSSGKVLLGIGPYLAMGVGGKHEVGSTIYYMKFKNDITSTANYDNYFKPLDFGAMLMAGYELSDGLSVALNASMGLTNLAPKLNGTKTKNSRTNEGFGLTLGYRFGKK